MKSLLSAGTFSPIAVLKIYLPKGQVVRAFSVVRPKIYLSRAIGWVGISSPAAVFLESLMSCREAGHHYPDIPTSQFENWSFLMISFVVAWCHSSLLFRWSLSPTHPMRVAECGGTAPYWLGAAQLEAGNSCPVRSKDLSHRQEQPLAPCSTPVKRWLITGDGSKGTARPLQSDTSDIAGVARTRLSTTTDCFMDSNFGFSLEVYS